MKINNLRVVFKTDQNNEPETVEIYYDLVDSGFANGKLITKNAKELDLTQSIADLWADTINEIGV